MVLSTFTSFCLRNQEECRSMRFKFSDRPYAAAEATAKKRLIARVDGVVISDARNRGLRRGPGLERNATAWAYLRARSAGRLVGRLVGFLWASILFASVLHAASYSLRCFVLA